MLVSILKATKKRTDNVKSNLQTGQYAGSVSPDHSQRQALVEPLAVALHGVTRYMNKFVCKVTQKRGSRLAIHTNGLICHWLKMVIALEVMVFLAFCILSFRSHKTSLSGSVFVMAPSKKKCPQLLHPILLRLRPLYRGTKVNPSGLPPFVRPTGSKVEERLMQVNDLLRIELVAKCLGKQPTFLVQEKPLCPSSSKILPQWHFVLS